MSQRKIISVELDPNLLSTPFKIHTNWIVLTGAASSGKSTLIDMFSERGFLTLPDSASLFTDSEMVAGRTIDEILEDVTTQPRIEEIQLRMELELEAGEAIFLDRALPDSLTYRRLVGLDPNEILVECFHHRYAEVFILDQLPFLLDGTRIADVLHTDLLDEWLLRDYRALGYQVVRVPVLPPQERLAFILDKLPGWDG